LSSENGKNEKQRNADIANRIKEGNHKVFLVRIIQTNLGVVQIKECRRKTVQNKQIKQFNLKSQKKGNGIAKQQNRNTHYTCAQKINKRNRRGVRVNITLKFQICASDTCVQRQSDDYEKHRIIRHKHIENAEFFRGHKAAENGQS
jgi:hypothetical protein